VLSEDDIALRRPRLFWVNLILTVLVMVVMIAGWVDPVVMFMLGTVVALCINYPNVDAQRARIDAHAKTALTMASILLAAGVFTGIMQGTGMLKAIAEVAVAQIPAGHGKLIPAVVGFLSMPLSMLFDPDSYYFGVMPVIAEVGKALGVDPLQVAQASLLGVHTTGFPVSPLTPATFLLVGLCKIELADHQRFTIPFLFAGIEVRLHDLVAHRIHAQVRSGEVDFGIGVRARLSHGLAFVPVLNDRLCAFVPLDHPLTRYAKLSLEQLAEQPIILTGRDSSVREQVDALFDETRLTMLAGMEANYMSTVLALVRQGLGISVLPESAADSLEGLKRITIDHPGVNREIGLISRSGQPLSPAAQRCFELLSEELPAAPQN